MEGVDSQLDLFGNEEPWEDATPKAQANHNRKIISQEKRDHTDNLVLHYMAEFKTPLSCRELQERLEPVGLTTGATFMALKRLRNSGQIEVAGEPDLECGMYQVLSNSRWQVRQTRSSNH